MVDLTRYWETCKRYREMSPSAYRRWARARAARFIKLRERGWTFERIAELEGVTRERIRQIITHERRP